MVFDETKLLPLFVASYSGIAPPLQPGTGTAPVRAPAQAPATRTSVVVSAKTTMAQVGADGKMHGYIVDQSGPNAIKFDRFCNGCHCITEFLLF